MTDKFLINAAWEKRGEQCICRWMIVWKRVGESSIVGVLSGYSGGGSFQLEQFVAHFSDTALRSLLIDLEDKITGEEINFFENVPSDLLEICDNAQDIVLEWNDQDEWEDAEQLILAADRKEILSQKEDLILLRTGNFVFFKGNLRESRDHCSSTVIDEYV